MINKDALTYILALGAGRKVIWDLLAGTGLYTNSFNPDQRMTDFSLGSQNVGLALYADCLEASPDLTALMIKEQGQYDNGTDSTSPDRPRSPAFGNSGPSGSDTPDDDPDSLGLGRGHPFGRD